MNRTKRMERYNTVAAAVRGCFAANQDLSSFNVDAFAQGQFEGANDTRYLRVEPKEYQAVIEGPFGEKGKSGINHIQDKGYVILNLMWRPNDMEQCAKLGLEQMPLIRQSIFLDVTPSGSLDMGPFKNSDLGRVREALGLNTEGQRWAFSDFVGRPAKIKVEHKPNEKDPANPHQNVTAVTKP